VATLWLAEADLSPETRLLDTASPSEEPGEGHHADQENHVDEGNVRVDAAQILDGAGGIAQENVATLKQRKRKARERERARTATWQTRKQRVDFMVCIRESVLVDD
jgi:hypothetical protein